MLLKPARQKANEIVKELIAVNRNVAEVLFGSQPGRPMISERAGRVIGKAIGCNPTLGKDLFHIALAVGAFVYFSKR